MAWLLTKTLGLHRIAWIGFAGAALVALFFWLSAREEADDKHNQEIGAQIQREGDLRETIERTEKANEAAKEIERNPDARRDNCLRYSRTPENC